MAEQGKVLKIVVLVCSAILSLVFLFSGGLKLTGAEELAKNFARWGYPPWALPTVGALEVAGAIGLWVKPVAFYAACGLVCTMLGAAVTHLTHGEASHVLPVVVILTLAALVAWSKRPGR